jgi:uncharacterized protein (TIGR02246 family)
MLPLQKLGTRIGLCVVAWIVPLLFVGTGAFAADKQATGETETAIRANVDAFVKAYNAGDAKAVAALFTPEGQLINENDQTTQGRDAIEHAFAAVFTASPKGHVDVHVGSIRVFGSALAVETGTTSVVDKPGADPDVTHYTVVHMKSLDGKWQMAFARDTSVSQDENTASPSEPVAAQGAKEAAAAPANATGSASYEKLKPLAWMIGNWIDEGEESVVISSCKWSADRNFLLQNVEVRREGRDALTIRQRIGWDPIARQIRAWVFDSNGGFGESYWRQSGHSWRAIKTGVGPDGVRSSSVDIMTPNGKDAYTWQSVDRVAGMQKLPPLEVKVVRKPPEPTK